jgi:hypothetical protein
MPETKLADDKECAHWTGNINSVTGFKINIEEKIQSQPKLLDDEGDDDKPPPLDELSDDEDDDFKSVIHITQKKSQFKKKLGQDYVVYLDNCADVSGANNKALLTDISQIKGSIGGINKSDPRLVTEGKGTFLEDFEFYYSPDFRQNIWSEGRILTTPGWSIKSNDSNNSRTVTAPNGREYVFKFTELRWSRDFSKDFNIHAFSSTVETELKNEQLFTKNEVERARTAGTLIRRLGFPSTGMIIPMIERGTLNNCPVTAADVLRCLKISDKAFISYYKGKATHRSVNFDKPINVPRLIDKSQILHMDVMFIAGQPFLVSVAKPMNLFSVTPMGKSGGGRATKAMQEAIIQHINVYAKYGFKIVQIKSDAEGIFTAQQQWLNSIGVQYTANPEDVKVGIVENAIKQIKNTARCILHSVPYHLSLIMLVWLVCYSVYCLNFQTSRTGREGLCPRQELTGERPDFKRDFRARSIKFLSLATGKIITRNQFKLLPLPQEYIVLMNEWAKLKAKVPDDLSSTWGKYLEIEDEGQEGPVIDKSIPLLLQRYQSPMVNVDAPRVPVAFLENQIVPGTVTQQGRN